MAKKIISKASVSSSSSRDDSSGYYSSSGERPTGTNGKRITKPLPGNSSAQSRSENNLARLNQLQQPQHQQQQQQQQHVNMMPMMHSAAFGGSMRASSPDVTVLKTKVMYHSRSDFRTVQQQEGAAATTAPGGDPHQEDHEQEAQVWYSFDYPVVQIWHCAKERREKSVWSAWIIRNLLLKETQLWTWRKLWSKWALCMWPMN